MQLACSYTQSEGMRQEELYRLLDIYAQDIILMMDRAGALIEVNQAAVSSYGYSKDELLRMSVFDMRPKHDRAGAKLESQRTFMNKSNKFETIHMRKDGSTFPVEVSAVAVTLGNREVVFSIVRDITERKNAEIATEKYQQLLEEMVLDRTQQVKQADDSFMKLFHANPAAMSIHDLEDGRYIDVNESFEVSLGFSRWEVLGKTPSELNIWFDEAERINIYQLMQQRKPIQSMEVRFRSKSGTPRVGLLSIQYVTIKGRECVFSVAMDITELRHYEREVLRLDRLNLVGQIAASIGHEVRNPMTTVRGYLQMLRGKGKLCEYTNQFSLMIEEIDRANQIITDFLSLAKNRLNTRGLMDIDNLIGAVSSLVEADALATGCNIVFSLNSGALIFADAKEINQLLLNLVRNAMEAVGVNGNIIIETRRETEGVILAVQNDGPPIPEHVIEALGTPFLTTKENGTGLGLPVCYSIAARNNAEIKVTSKESYTRFEVVFPDAELRAG